MKTKQEQIEQMAVIGCVRNPQAHTAEECAKCDFKQGQCNAYRHAKTLIENGYGNISEYKAEIERLKAENCELTEKLKARLTCDFVKTVQKQAQIDVLNEAKEKLDSAPNGWAYTGYIDDLIEEVQKQ